MAASEIPATAGIKSAIKVEPLPAINGIPTAANVAEETRRMIQIHIAQAMSNGTSMDPSAYGDSIVRHFKVVGASSGMLTTDSIAQVIHNLTENITQQISAGHKNNPEQNPDVQKELQNLRREVHLLRQDVYGLAARLSASNARLYNSRFAESGKVQYETVVKHTAGHPFPNPPAFPNFQLASYYDVSAQPPVGLLPSTRDVLRQMIIGQLDVIRPRLRAIYWFYNDLRLALDEDADLAACNRFLVALEEFLKLS